MNTFKTETDSGSGALATHFGKCTQKRIEEIQQTLIKLRDTLLSKLILGILRVSDAKVATHEIQA